uniref:Uncharacterized protein n=1 Tax=Parascaris equorum TaxID=6256 RepID=A0A914S3E4_PAREQ
MDLLNDIPKWIESDKVDRRKKLFVAGESVKHSDGNPCMMGAVLVEEYPYAYVVGNEQAVTVCAHCMTSLFCAGDPEENEECSFLMKVKPRVPTAMARLLARYFVDELKNHSDEIKEDGEKSEFFMTLSHVLFEYMGADYLPPASELLIIFGRVMVNVFTISNDDLNTIGLGLYLGLSALDHSCDPDAFVLFNGRKAVLRSLKQHITAYDSNIVERLRIAYCDLLELTSMRRNQLRQQFFFICECSVCLDLERERTARSVRCRHCVDGYCPLDVNENSLVCWQCGATSEVHVDDAME